LIMPIESYDHVLVNNMIAVNQIVKKKVLLKREWKKFFSLKQGLMVFLLNCWLSPFPRFTRLYDAHTASSFLKSDMKEACGLIANNLEQSFISPFRSFDDYSIQFVRYYQIIKGHSVPRNAGFGKTANSNNPDLAERLIRSRKKDV